MFVKQRDKWVQQTWLRHWVRIWSKAGMGVTGVYGIVLKWKLLSIHMRSNLRITKRRQLICRFRLSRKRRSWRNRYVNVRRWLKWWIKLNYFFANQTVIRSNFKDVWNKASLKLKKISKIIMVKKTSKLNNFKGIKILLQKPIWMRSSNNS